MLEDAFTIVANLDDGGAIVDVYGVLFLQHAARSAVPRRGLSIGMALSCAPHARQTQHVTVVILNEETPQRLRSRAFV